MKNLRFFLVSTFLVSLLAGIWAGNYIFPQPKNHPPITPTPSTSKSILGKQDGVWLIAVDRINKTTPKIKGVWLLAYIIGYEKLIPLPFYPSDNSQQDTELVKSFRITDSHQIAPAFWDNLPKHGQIDQKYIVVDEIAAVEIINFFGGVTIEGKHLSGIEILSQAKNTQSDPHFLIKRQTVIMDSICKSIFNNQSVPDFPKLRRKIEKNILTNLDLGEQSMEIEKYLFNGEHKICEFPDYDEISSKP
jgi:hypothetical protein